MAETPSKMIPLGITAPDFTLKDVVKGQDFHLLKEGTGRATLIMFICNHCPFVKHVLRELVALGDDYTLRGIKLIAISSNDVTRYPEDSPEKMKELALDLGFPFPYLYDELQEVARNYDAACTPDFYIFDDKLQLVYRGQLDDSRPGNNIPVTGKDIRKALDLILESEEISFEQKPSIGCSIKWK
jgi:peroxiredoxin